MINKRENRKYGEMSQLLINDTLASAFDSHPFKYALIPSLASCHLGKGPLNRLRKLSHCHLVSGNRMALSMIE